MNTLYNLDFIHEITNGKKDIMKKLLENFIQDAPAAVYKLQHLDSLKKYEEMKMEAHSAKPLFNSIAALDAIRAIEKIETYCSSPVFYELITIEMSNLSHITKQICLNLEITMNDHC
jgi:hypothetical protein